jgi:hypothetical protein
MLNSSFPFNKEVAKEAFQSKDCPAIVLYAIIVAAYGDELHNPATMESMDAVELWVRIKSDFNAICSEESENRINAIRLAIETDLFETDSEAFIAICKGISYGDISDAIAAALDDLSVAEIGLALQEIKLIRDDEFEFSKEVKRVIAEEMKEEAVEYEGAPAVQLLEENKEDIVKWFKQLEADESAFAHI